MGHPEVQGRNGRVIGKEALEADEKQTSWEGNASSDVVKRFGIIHLEAAGSPNRMDGSCWASAQASSASAAHWATQARMPRMSLAPMKPPRAKSSHSLSGNTNILQHQHEKHSNRSNG